MKRLLRFALGGWALAFCIGTQISFVPSVSILGADITWIVGSSLFGLVGAASGIALSLIISLAERK